MADAPLRATLGALEGGNLDLETICSLGYPQVVLRPASGHLDKQEALSLAEEMMRDLLWESEILYTIGITPDFIFFSLSRDLDGVPEPELVNEMTSQLKDICESFGFQAQQRGPSSRLLDVTARGRVTRYLAVGRRNARNVRISSDVDAVVTMDYSDDMLSENPTLGDRKVLFRSEFIELMAEERIEECLEESFCEPDGG